MNQTYLDHIKKLLNDDFEAYVDTLSLPAYRGLRVNSLKLSAKEFEKLSPWTLESSSFHKNSYYISRAEKGIGRHPAHIAGLIYLQEPSASGVADLLDVKPGNWVLDLCAAPGGKSSQLAASLNHTGLLVSNEIDRKRAMILLSNLERMGISENMITNSKPDVLCQEMAGCFDRVLVDAPCSGEGMFKINEQAMTDWSMEHVSACAVRQKHILDSAYTALKTEGILVYSTCTYAIEENEAVIDAFLREHEDMELLPIEVDFGRTGFDYGLVHGSYVRRIFPMDKGEGHFMAKLKKHGDVRTASLKTACSAIPPEAITFLNDQISTLPTYSRMLQDKLFMMNHEPLQLKKTTVLRQGVLVGEVIKKRFEPHHHFYMAAVNRDKFLKRYEMNDHECAAFLHGDVIASSLRGYHAMCWQGYVLGFSKGDGTYLKNKFPKGLRLT